jgi:hypothetical protein
MKNIVLPVIFVLLFCFTELTLGYFWPDRVSKFSVWEEYYIKKDGIYDAMFCIASYLVFKHTKGIVKAIMFFALVLTGGSFFDKQIMGINQYLYSDIALVVVGGVLAVYLYNKKWKTSRSGLSR